MSKLIETVKDSLFETALDEGYSTAEALCFTEGYLPVRRNAIPTEVWLDGPCAICGTEDSVEATEVVHRSTPVWMRACRSCSGSFIVAHSGRMTSLPAMVAISPAFVKESLRRQAVRF